ncbi:MAG: vWA domain-containing protein [Candidatus Altiarchaeia archaeon]
MYGLEQPLVLALAIPLLIAAFLYIRRPNMNKKKWIYYATRSLYLSLLLFALASPYLIVSSEKFQDTAQVTILNDLSDSMYLFEKEKDLASDLYSVLRGQLMNATGCDNVRLKSFSNGSRTEIGDALYQNSADSTRDNNLLILVSDGNNNYGRNAKDVAKAIGGSNTRVFSFTPEKPSDEIYIKSVDGDRKVPLNSMYFYTVGVSKLGNIAEYTLKVNVGDKEVGSAIVDSQSAGEQTFNFSVSFKEVGVHTINAQLYPRSPDKSKENNKYIKTVDVVDKPEVFVVTAEKDSPLMAILTQSYLVSSDKTLPEDLSIYSSFFLDDRNASTLSVENIAALNKYVIDGGGLVVVGGERSYERGNYHQSTSLEAMLPVRSVEEPEKKRKEMAVVILLDISQSTAYGLQSDSKIAVEKALALNIVKQMDLKDHVGVVAFNVEAFDIHGIGRLSEGVDDINDKIPRLQFGGGTDMLSALDRADQMLEPYSLDKYVIIISDGVLGTRSGSRGILTNEKVSVMSNKGITFYTVGVGFDTDEAFMANLAKTGNGLYFKPEAYERLKMAFEEKDSEKNLDRYKLDIYNKYHFITSSLEIPDTSIKNYNDVTPKSISQVLVTTEGLKPIITVWRFGLGRVASITTDNGNRWSPGMYSADKGKVVSAVTNWAIGDLEKKKSVRIDVADVSYGEPADVYVKSDSAPRLFATLENGSIEEVSVKQTDLDMYTARITPRKAGTYSLKAQTASGVDQDGYSVNYPLEYGELGINAKELKDITESTKGARYNASKMQDLIDDAIEYVRAGSLKEVKEKQPIAVYFVACALGLYFIDTVIRRINELKRLKKE